jgi:hypothetical protein
MSRFILALAAFAVLYSALAATEHLSNTLPPTIAATDTAACASWLTRALFLITNL